MCITLVFWLFVSTPVPLKLEIIDENSATPRSNSVTLAWNVENLKNKYQTLTIQDTIGNQP